MQLLSAILMTLLQSAIVIAALVAVLFGGTLLITEAGPSVRQGLETPERLQELEDAGIEHAQRSGSAQAEATAHTARRKALALRLEHQRNQWQQDVDDELRAIQEAAEQQIEGVQDNLEQNQQVVSESVDRLQGEYCDSWNPVNWWACRQMQGRVDDIDERIRRQQQAVEENARRLRSRAHDDAVDYRQDAEEQLERQTADIRQQLQASIDAMEQLEESRQQLDGRVEAIQHEAATLREDNWIWIEFRDRWPYLLAVALLIFAAPYMRRTLWYFAGMPLVSRARPIELAPPPTKDDQAVSPKIGCGPSRRSLELEIPAGERLLARSGYVQSDREGATSELFFDRQAPNLSFISGLVLLTRLQTRQAGDQSRDVVLGTPDDPDAYLMRVDLEDHPGVVVRASHVVGVVGDIDIDSTWRLTNLHAWATSQVRFIVFSGTGTLIVEGWGDVDGSDVDGGREQKRMPLVIGFDTRLSYRTQRAATFLPYLVDPGREPLVVDVFDGQGMVLFEKNPSERKQSRSTGEAIAGFFLDAFRKLLGL